ncbi:glycoside hydrolase family 3 protein [Glycomyces buryatensis]|nr:glycoside hydrolase family 3 protein [Glycomyces buryatensis]
MTRKTLLASGAVGAVGLAGAAVAYAESGGVPLDEAGHDDAVERRRAYVKDRLAAMSLEDKVGQLFMVYAHGTSADTDDPDDVAANRDHLGADNAAAFITECRPGGIIYFNWANNVEDPEQIARLSNGLQEAATADEGVPLFVAVDQEYGTVARIAEPVTQFPGAMPLGATGDAGAAQDAAQLAGDELGALGLNLNFAPDADVNVNPANPVIGVRSFSSDPDTVAEMTSAQIMGYQTTNLAACAKHFPGHGDTDVDSHVGLPVITHTYEEWEEIDAPPFKAAIAVDADMIMSAHLQFPALDESLLPATLSEPILTGLLRDRLGYEGVIVTDSLEMEGVRTEYGDEDVPVMALQAGADLLLMPPDFRLARDAVLAAVEAGELTEQRIDASVRRLLSLKWARGLTGDPFVDPDKALESVGTEAGLAAAADIADRSVTLLRNDGTLPATAASVLVTGWGENTTARLVDAFASLGVDAQTLVTGDAPDQAAIDAAVAAAEDRDLVVAVTYKVAASSSQIDLIAALREAGAPLVSAAVGTPYDAAHLPEDAPALATYSYTAASLASLAKVIMGQGPEGKLPVDVPTAAGPDTILFERGHGLSY